MESGQWERRPTIEQPAVDRSAHRHTREKKQPGIKPPAACDGSGDGRYAESLRGRRRISGVLSETTSSRAGEAEGSTDAAFV